MTEINLDRVDLSPAANAPKIAHRVYVIGENPNEGPHAVLIGLEKGTGLIEWFDERGQRRGQAFRADRLTSSRAVATADVFRLREAGWNV